MYIPGLTSHATSTRARTSASLQRVERRDGLGHARETRASQADTQTSIDACSIPRKQ